jgi:preprotein translocase subunit SecG
MKTVIIIFQILISIGLMSLILLQSSKGGLGTAFGGGGEFHTKRGAEKIVFKITIVFACLFLIISIINLVM